MTLFISSASSTNHSSIAIPRRTMVQTFRVQRPGVLVVHRNMLYVHCTVLPTSVLSAMYEHTSVASAHLRLSGESLENRHKSSAQYKRDSSLLSEQWTQPAAMRASATSTQVALNTFAGVASGMVNWRRGGVGDLPPLAIGRSRPAPRFLNMVLCTLC